GLRDGDRRGSQMLAEQAPQLTLAETEAAGQRVEVIFVQGAELDQTERARDRVRGAPPRAKIASRLGAAGQARANAGFLCGRRGREEDDVVRKRRPRWTHWAAIDARGLDACEEPAVETGIAVNERAVAGVVIEIHAGNVVAPSAPV